MSLQETESKRPLEEESREIEDSIRVAKKRAKPQGSFNTEFWTNATRVEELMIQRQEVNRKISLRDFPGSEAQWQATEEAKRIFEQIQAHKVQHRICSQRLEKVTDNGTGKRSLRASFMKLFTTSKMGLGIKQTGAGERGRWIQMDFKTSCIDAYEAGKPREKTPLWCPVLGEWCDRGDVRAGHLFAYMHTQETMDAIFGRRKEPELFAPRNGLLLYKNIEKYFDSGKLVIVPDIPDHPSVTNLNTWITKKPREYKLRILDKSWDQINERVTSYFDTTWADLDNKHLEFRGSFRPRARYLYFHYCVQVLRYAWQQEDNEDRLLTLKHESGRPFWGTRGRYIKRNMLRAFIEELGHEDHLGILEGASCRSSGDSNLLLDAVSRQVVERPNKLGLGEWPSDDENDSDEESISDSDCLEWKV